MREILRPVALLFCLAAIVSCKKNAVIAYTEPAYDNPITDYDIVPDPTDAFTFTFKNKSTNFKRLEWRFGDDTLKTEDSPVHTYFATGKYTVDLKAFSKTTDQSTRKLVDINIVPDSVLKVTTTKVEGSAGASTVQLSLAVKAPIAKVLWTFTDAPVNGASTGATSTSTEQNPTRTYQTGTFNAFTVTVTTTKGSVATISRNITTEGIAEDITQKRIGYNSVLENGSDPNGNESSSKLVDGNKDTKFGLYGFGARLNDWAYTISYDNPVTIKLYAIENGNDSGNDRDPKEWVLEGSNDGITWTELDHQNNGSGFYAKATAAGIVDDQAHYKRFWYYPITNPQPFSQIRLRTPSGTFNGNDFQLGEFQLFR